MAKRITFTLIGLLIVFGGIFGWYIMRQYFMKKYFASFVPPPQAVSVAIAKSDTWQPFLYSVGNLKAVDGVEISSEVSGQVKAIYFKSGEFVKKGQALVQLDDASEQAQLRDISAQLQLAKVTDMRTKKLFTQGATSQASVDDSSSKTKQLKANFENISSAIAKKLIRAPFSGKIGIKLINVGQYISPGLSCASLQSSHILNVQFTLPQQEVSKIALRQEVLVVSDAYPNLNFKGTITAIDSKIDESTRTIEAQATIENIDNKLLPGMFVNAKIFLPAIPNTITLPQTAITYTLYGDSAFLVRLNDKKSETGQELGTVSRILVKTGEKRDNTVVILEGIKAGDMIVISGQLKLVDGTSIVINNSVKL
ncbi:efflux RND transporter periplasmic adaptor subunit [Fluviispira sanaruensis]|uniref:MexH family multidrug efflux RND transporter periplasmic adaptor subunit n=1 Tax=Fluviispira sanaruensis TaxID=2493639 RepID=A0A4P2VIK7_FLUSA|nr:efflux RND transporter periplasmic adaptor subunit [Fluviispira sanaruensis]BBH52973.1 MexH family multidrug efflux RND transporter periplasmic adaptor subunit [Fluviispira sanaruensis]